MLQRQRQLVQHLIDHGLKFMGNHYSFKNPRLHGQILHSMTDRVHMSTFRQKKPNGISSHAYQINSISQIEDYRDVDDVQDYQYVQEISFVEFIDQINNMKQSTFIADFSHVADLFQLIK